VLGFVRKSKAEAGSQEFLGGTMTRIARLCVMAALMAPMGAGRVAVSSAQAPAQGAQPAARAPQNQVARVTDLMQMMAALPEAAPATPKRPRRVLVLAKASGFIHASIPLATRTIEALGQKTGAWTAVISYNAADITAENLQQYDGIFLASTTGSFLDEPGNEAVTASRRNALLDFIRGGKGMGRFTPPPIRTTAPRPARRRRPPPPAAADRSMAARRSGPSSTG
jgi:hypothetical protein